MGSLASTEEQRALAESVERFLAGRVPMTAVRERLGSAQPWTAEQWKELVALGAAGALVPGDHGGLGLALSDVGEAVAAMGRRLFGGPFASTSVAAVTALAPTGDELLSRIADGSCVVAVAPDAAVAASAGRLRGEATHVLDAVGADVLLVAAEQAWYAVPAGQSGVHVEHTPTLDATRSRARVTLDAAQGRRLDTDPAQATRALRLALCTDGCGAAAAAFDLALGYATTREQFDRPIGSFQAVQHLLVDAFTALRLAHLLVGEALQDPSTDRVSLAVAHCTAELPKVSATAIQVLGGFGYSWEADAHLYHRRLLGLQTLCGTENPLDQVAAAIVDSSA